MKLLEVLKVKKIHEHRTQYSLTLRKKIDLFEVYKSPSIPSVLSFPSPPKNPTLSILVVNRNGLKYLESTLVTISQQTFRDYELIIVDGASTDGSVEFLTNLENIVFISEPDNGMDEGFLKGLNLAAGKYITHCCVSDGYLDPSWLQKAIAKIETESDLSLVWGFPRTLDSNGILKHVAYSEFHLIRPFSRRNYYLYWLCTGVNFPEGNYVIDINVMKKCFPSRPRPGMNYSQLNYDPWLTFVGNFHSSGYLSAFIPSIANFGRLHADSVTKFDEVNSKTNLIRDEYNQFRQREKNFFSTRGNSKKFLDRFGYKIYMLKRVNYLIELLLIKMLLFFVRGILRISMPFIRV